MAGDTGAGRLILTLKCMSKNKSDKINLDDVVVVNNIDDNQFEINISDLQAFIPYSISKGKIAFFHTEVPEELEGNGLATKLTLHALNYAKDNELKILPYCPFIAAYIEKHPEWKKYVGHLRD